MSLAKITEIANHLTSIESSFVTFEARLTATKNSSTLISSTLDGAPTTPSQLLLAMDAPGQGFSRVFTLTQQGHIRLWLLYHDVEVAVSFRHVDISDSVPDFSKEIKEGEVVLAKVEQASVSLITRATPNVPLAQDQIGAELEFDVVVLPDSPNSRSYRPKVGLVATFTPDSTGIGTFTLARGLRIYDEATLQSSMRPPKVFREFRRAIREYSSRLSVIGTIPLPVPTEIPGYNHPMTLRCARISDDATNPFMSLFARLEKRPKEDFPFLSLAGETADLVMSIWGDLILNKVVAEIQSFIADVTLESHSYNASTRSIEFQLRRVQNKKRRIFGKRVGAKCISEATFSIAFDTSGTQLLVAVSLISVDKKDVETSPSGFKRYFRGACVGSFSAFDTFNTFFASTTPYDIYWRVASLAAVVEDHPGHLEVQASFS